MSNKSDGNQRLTRGHWGALGTVLIGVTTLANCCPNCPEPETVIPGGGLSVMTPAEAAKYAEAAQYGECPMHSVHIYVKGLTSGGADSARIVTVIPNVQTNIPEFNDCQKFVKNGAYTGVFAIWSRANLGAYLQGSPPMAPGTQGTFVAIIYSWDTPYTELGIQPGFNCLYLRRLPLSGPTPLDARMVNNFTNETCPLTFPMATTGSHVTALVVDRPAVTTHPADYPPVARWGWDAMNQRHYIGVRCDGWCSVGAGPLNPASALTSAVSTFSGGDHVVGVAGWFDDQQLSRATGTTAQLSGVRGTVIPHPALDSYSNDGVFTNYSTNGGWVPVAYVGITPSGSTATADIAAYTTKLGFATAPVTGTLTAATLPTLNQVFMCKGAGCVGITTTTPCGQMGFGETMPTNPADQWWAKIIPAGGVAPIVYRCVIKKPETVAAIPGTARWRWKAVDETVWVRCPAGCCELH